MLMLALGDEVEETKPLSIAGYTPLFGTDKAEKVSGSRALAESVVVPQEKYQHIVRTSSYEESVQLHGA